MQVAEIEKTFGVDASAAVAAPQMMAAGPAAAAAPVVEEKTTFDVRWEAVQGQPVSVPTYWCARRWCWRKSQQIRRWPSTRSSVALQGLP